MRVSNALRILVVEDDRAIRTGLCDMLRAEGIEPIEAGTAAQGRALALGENYDLALLDLMLPGGDGLAILRTLRAARPAQPVIILTARGDEADRVEGLRLGADDYVVKPFSPRELVARIRAVLRRSPARTADIEAIDFPSLGITADLRRREVRRDQARGAPADLRGAIEPRSPESLSEKEAELLQYLAANTDRAVSREELLAGVWRLDPHGMETRTIDMHVARLREKLGDHAESPSTVLTVRGKGYALARDAVIRRGSGSAGGRP